MQLLPGADEKPSSAWRNINALPPVSQMIESGMTPEQICFAALEGFSPEILDETSVGYVCNCSRERVERALLSLGREELRAMRDEEERTKWAASSATRNTGLTKRIWPS
ncbi:MAG: Hsp33 family molecular chaperone HslO [Oscillospiraceae bacterium]